MIEQNSWNARVITHEGIAAELSVQCHRRTITRAIARANLRMRIAARVHCLDERARLRRLNFAQIMLQKYPRPED